MFTMPQVEVDSATEPSSGMNASVPSKREDSPFAAVRLSALDLATSSISRY